MLASPTPASAEDVARVQSLASVLHAVDPTIAQILADADTTIERVPTPFFRHAAVYRLLHAPLGYPMAFTLGHAEDWATVLLERNTDGWMQLTESGLDVSTPDLRLAYAIGYLECTRSFEERFVILRDPTEIGSFTDLDAKQRAALEQARARVETPLFSLSESAPWIARLYVLRGYALVRVYLKFGANGIVERTDELLQDDIPLPLAL